jgi:hypothetical protein
MPQYASNISQIDIRWLGVFRYSGAGVSGRNIPGSTGSVFRLTDVPKASNAQRLAINQESIR